ncbi:tyrosine--tRNA ligase [Patescibacteria group bacterium]|nr:tyrosine--tRNA ligase [Patescibacteria group bacterium]
MEIKFTSKDCVEAAVAEIIGQEALEAGFTAGKKLRVKLGIDPTSPNVHLGRSIPLWRLRAFQELGHEIHLIIGDFTGQIGDTSDKESERPMLSVETVQNNLSRYLEQMWMILNVEKKDQVIVHYNSEWLNPLSLSQLSYMADAFSVNHFIKRELIERRLQEGSRVSLREMLYPLMQGYDSVKVQADVEIGGTDQRFNLLAGRILQEQAGQPPQAIIMNTLIRGTDGRKMSSSWGNVISLLDSPADKFGKLMAVRDDCIADYLLVLPLSVRPFTADELTAGIEKGENPRDYKLRLARTLVTLYHGEDEAKRVEDEFINQFSHHQKPVDIPEISVSELGAVEWELPALLEKIGLADSRSDGRRLIRQGGVRLDDWVVKEENETVRLDRSVLLQVGKRKFIRILP